MNNFPTISIANVKQIFNLAKNHPVFRLTPHTGSEFVIKADRRGGMGSAAPGIAKFDATLMTKISNNTDIELLTKTEVLQLQGCFSVVQPIAERMSFQKNALSPDNFWYKMPLLKVTTMESMFDNEEGKMLRKVFKLEKNLVKLGKIAAVDTFIGNADRFDPNGNLSNLGNIFFAKKRGLRGKTFTPIGLDFWNGFSEDMNLTLGQSRWDTMQQTHPKDFYETQSRFIKWLLTLNDNGRMQTFAQNAVESLNGELERNHVDSINTQKTKYKILMARGMEEGAGAIKKYLKDIIAQKGMGGIPAGALYRMRILKWV
ncbi:MAG TPA: hypothetical protein VH595_18155 [Verrucomicrobiae bacterium]|jgi:hypothetical protein|nr:hypothetical protein [Verrucomicrobiae bacterium]